jgi:hypothetical protein
MPRQAWRFVRLCQAQIPCAYRERRDTRQRGKTENAKENGANFAPFFIP